MEKTEVYAVLLAFADWFRLATAGSGSAGRRTRVRLPRVVRLAALEFRQVPSTPTVASYTNQRARRPRARSGRTLDLEASALPVELRALRRHASGAEGGSLEAQGSVFPFSRWPGTGHRAIDLLTVRFSLEQPVLPQKLPGDCFFGFPVHVHGRVQVTQCLVVQLLGYGGEDIRELGVLVHNLLADGK